MELDTRRLLAALVGLADYANGRLGRNSYSIDQFREACNAAAAAIGRKPPENGKCDMDGIDAARIWLENDYREKLAAAINADYPTDQAPNHSDIAAALRNGFTYAAAHLLNGATETPALDKFVEEFGPWPMNGGHSADFDEWAAWFKENTIECESCNAFNFTDEFIPCGCANCGARIGE